MTIIALLILAFFVGSIPSGYLVGRLHGIDIRQQGSGNTGATNANRVLGKRAGVITLFCDMLKGIVALMLALFFSETSTVFPDTRQLAGLLGLAALVGHCYSPFLHFKGGKGVATGGGVFLVIAPLQTMLALAVFAMTVKLTKFVSLGSILAAITVPVLLFVSPSQGDRQLALYAGLGSALIIFRHKDNIRRLLAGEEPKISR